MAPRRETITLGAGYILLGFFLMLPITLLILKPFMVVAC